MPKNQIKLIGEVIAHPVNTLSGLPSQQFLIVGLLVYFFSKIGNAIRLFVLFSERLSNANSALPSGFRSLISCVLLIIVIPVTYLLGVVVTKFVVQLFGKSLSFIKVANIINYAAVPSILSVLISLMFVGSFEMERTIPQGWNEAQYVLVRLLAVLPRIYSFIILIRGFIHSKAES